jgi:hypothetical protein
VIKGILFEICVAEEMEGSQQGGVAQDLFWIRGDQLDELLLIGHDTTTFSSRSLAVDSRWVRHSSSVL